MSGELGRSTGVNLGILRDICCSTFIDAAPTGLVFLDTRFYIDAEETPRQINPTGLKRFLKYSRSLCKIRCGWKPHLPDLGAEAVIFLKLTFMVETPVTPTAEKS